MTFFIVVSVKGHLVQRHVFCQAKDLLLMQVTLWLPEGHGLVSSVLNKAAPVGHAQYLGVQQ